MKSMFNHEPHEPKKPSLFSREPRGSWFSPLVIYLKMLRISFRSMTQFRADFLTGLLGVITLNGVNLLAIGVILGRFHELAGWTVWQIVFLYGVWMTGNSLYSLLFLHLANLDEMIIDGTFDRFLLRPLGVFLQFLGSDVNMNGIPDLIFGVTCLTLSMARLGLHLAVAQWLFLAVMLFSSAFIELGITLALSSVAFWSGRSYILVYAVNQVNWNMTQQYPLDMFGRGFRILVTCLIPVAFLNYYPARWLLGKTTPADPDYFLSFMAPLVALILLAIASFAWKRGVRQYNSTGS